MTELAFILSAVAVVATVLPVFKRGYWWLRLFDFPRPQIAAIGAAGVALLALAVPPGPAASAAIAATAVAIGYQLYRIFPYLPVARRQVVRCRRPDTDRDIGILVANVLMDNRRADDLLRIVRSADPDIVIAMETDDWWASALRALERTHPHTLLHPLDNTYGLLVYSRLALPTASLRFLTDDAVPSAFLQVALRSGDVIDLYAMHPAPPQPRQDTFERDAELLMIAREIRQSGRPAIVAGDLNDVAWSHTTRLFQRISGLLDPRAGRGAFSSYNAKIPFLRWPLDHIFHHPAFQLRQIRRLGYFGSDHFPIYGRLVLRPGTQFLHNPPQAEATDRREAGERIAEVTDP